MTWAQIYTEGDSDKKFINNLLKRFYSEDRFKVSSFEGKPDLLNSIENRLRALGGWLPKNWFCLITVDQDDDDCAKLKEKIYEKIDNTKLIPKKERKVYHTSVRIIISELESWYFGEPEALSDAYPGLEKSIDHKLRYRPDSVNNPSRRLSRLLKNNGYFTSMKQGNFPKIKVANQLSNYYDPDKSNSTSFQQFWEEIERFNLPVN